MITDLSNDILSCGCWDSDELLSLCIRKLNKPTLLNISMSFIPNIFDDVVAHPYIHGRSDTCINDLINIVLFQNNRCRLGDTTILDLHIFGRSLDNNEPTPRDDLFAMKKLRNEGSLKESLEFFWLGHHHKIFHSLSTMLKT